jgi:hypothetical protein
MLAAHEVCDIDAVPAPERQWEQQQGPVLRIAGDHDEGANAVAFADLALPGRDEVIPLIGGVGFCRSSSSCQIASAWPRSAKISMAATRPGFDHAVVCAVRPLMAAAMVIATLVGQELFTIFSFGRHSQGNVNKE